MQIGTVYRWLVMAAWTLAAGCATSPQTPPPANGNTPMGMREPKGAGHYVLGIGTASSGATPFRRVTPIYPADQLAMCPSLQKVKVQLIVDKTGKVSRARVADETKADADRLSFIAAARTAVLQWNFVPLHVNNWVADADGNTHAEDSEPVPFSETFVFRFECRAGIGSVTNGRSLTPRA